jgi:hypothetical protein
MQVALENRRKATTESPRNVIKRNNRAKEGGASRLRVKKEQESTESGLRK